VAIAGEPGASPGAVDPTRWLARLASVTATDLAAALDEIAERVHEVFPVDVVSVMVVDDLEHEGITRGYCVGSSRAAQAIAPLLTPDGIDPVGVGEAAFEAGRSVVWPHLVSEPAELARLARLADAGGPAGALHRLMLDAGGLAVPLSAPHAPALGAVALVSLTRENPLPARAVEQLQALAPQLALTVRNHQLAARNRRNRHTLEGVISSSPMGVIVSDVQGRLSIANAAAGEILAMDLEPFVGTRLAVVIDEHVKWRFVNPDEYAARLHRMHAQETGRTTLEAETVDGRAIEHSASPVRDSSGQTVGRVVMLHDVTAARTALAEARRLAEERAALLEAEERRAHEDAALARAAHSMALTLTPADIHERLLEESMRLLPACEKVAVLTVDRRGVVMPAAARGFAEGSVSRMTSRSGEGVVGRVMADGRPFICNDTAVDERISNRITRAEGIRSFMHVPLMLGGRVHGLVSVNSGQPRAFGERELRLISELARHAQGALQNALRYEQERRIAETLQQALLAAELPRIPGVELAALYQPAAGSQVGGDFYSAWPLPGARLALLVGDVSGKGVEAAGITAMVRYMTEALSHHRGEPAALVGELNEMLCPRMADGSLVTLVVVVIDTAGEMLRWCSAGHPPPVVVSGDGAYRTLEDPDPPCGIFPGQRFHAGMARFAPGDLLFTYTDGLIEARRDGEEFGERRLREAVLEVAGERPDHVARAVYATGRTWSEGRLTDDVAIAVVKRVPVRLLAA
jgi:serine phosphatase RsbU (regulator of sigma subunit)/PAS domain-containing protein